MSETLLMKWTAYQLWASMLSEFDHFLDMVTDFSHYNWVIWWFQAYLDFFAQAINMEYKDQGITVQTLMPMMVAGNSKYAFQTPNMLVPSASNYAHQAISTLGWSDRTTGCLSHTIQVTRDNTAVSHIQYRVTRDNAAVSHVQYK